MIGRKELISGMALRYNVEKLKKVINDFNIATGISASILDVDYKHVAGGPISANKFCALIHTGAEGRKRCRVSDRELLDLAKERRCAVTRPCHAGLSDTVVPIYSHEMLLGFIMFGQIDDGDGKRTPFDEIYERIKDIELNKDELRCAYESSVFSDRRKIESAIEIVTILTKYIIFEHLIEPEYGKMSENVAKYIEENITEELGVGVICKRFHISKSMLYREFKVRFGCTVGEYITAKRMELAEQLLRTTENSISDISEKCGIENCQYFCRVFKKNRGITPLQYRKTVHR